MTNPAGSPSSSSFHLMSKKEVAEKGLLMMSDHSHPSSQAAEIPLSLSSHEDRTSLSMIWRPAASTVSASCPPSMTGTCSSLTEDVSSVQTGGGGGGLGGLFSSSLALLDSPVASTTATPVPTSLYGTVVYVGPPAEAAVGAPDLRGNTSPSPLTPAVPETSFSSSHGAASAWLAPPEMQSEDNLSVLSSVSDYANTHLDLLAWNPPTVPPTVTPSTVTPEPVPMLPTAPEGAANHKIPSTSFPWLQNWDRQTLYSDLIADGLAFLNGSTAAPAPTNHNVVMLFESPSTAGTDTSFVNQTCFRFHDYPPSSAASKAILGPCRYSLMNGATYPVFLRDGAPPTGLLDHWQEALPHVFGNNKMALPTYVDTIDLEHQLVYAYLPCETIPHHVNDPAVHYHVVGKDAIPLMTEKTTRLLPSTAAPYRPCVVKTTHSMGSKGIFVIRNDQDEAAWWEFYHEAGQPQHVITEYVEIDRNVACHFFMHPAGQVIWMGSNENFRLPETGHFSSDSYLNMDDQAALQQLQAPFVHDVVQYCQRLGYWGFCGVDVLVDRAGRGYTVDINPRLTGSCPSIMVLQLLHEQYGWGRGIFRRSGGLIFYLGRLSQLLDEVRRHNQEQEGQCRVVIFSAFEEQGVLEEEEETTTFEEPHPTRYWYCKVNMGVYAHDFEHCLTVLNRFCGPKPTDPSQLLLLPTPEDV